MSARTPPPPSDDFKTWSRQLYNYLVGEAQIKQRVEPTPILLAHKSAVVPERAAVSGLLLYDPVSKKVIYSRDGDFFPVSDTPVIPPGTIISDTAPSNPEVGQLWWRTAEPVGLFIWYQDTDSSQWVQVSGSAGGGVSEPVPAFATVPEALTGVVTDKIMSPALVQARSGVDIRNMSGTSVLFSNVPPEATEYAILIGLEYPANGVVTLDFINAPGLSCSWSRQLMAGSYAAPAGGSGDPAMTIDTDTTGRTLNGLIHMVRDGNGGTWRAHGRYRQSASRVVALDATVSMGGATAAVPRLNCAQGGGFISGVTSIRWRV